MANHDFEPEEIDRLVKELASSKRAPAPRPAVTPSETSAAAPLSASDSGAPSAGRPFTTARLIMPAVRSEPKSSKVRDLAAAIPLPKLPALGLPRLPELDESQWSALSTNIFVGLGVLLGAAMPFWPYAHAWSWGLLIYLGAVQLVVVTGIWGAKLTWDARLPAAHTVSCGTAIWGLGLLAAEAVPRIGYAATRVV